MCNISTTFGLI